jgi:hypothetical protein
MLDLWHYVHDNPELKALAERGVDVAVEGVGEEESRCAAHARARRALPSRANGVLSGAGWRAGQPARCSSCGRSGLRAAQQRAGAGAGRSMRRTPITPAPTPHPTLRRAASKAYNPRALQAQLNVDPELQQALPWVGGAMCCWLPSRRPRRAAGAGAGVAPGRWWRLLHCRRRGASRGGAQSGELTRPRPRPAAGHRGAGRRVEAAAHALAQGPGRAARLWLRTVRARGRGRGAAGAALGQQAARAGALLERPAGMPAGGGGRCCSCCVAAAELRACPAA